MRELTAFSFYKHKINTNIEMQPKENMLYFSIIFYISMEYYKFSSAVK